MADWTVLADWRLYFSTKAAEVILFVGPFFDKDISNWNVSKV